MSKTGSAISLYCATLCALVTGTLSLPRGSVASPQAQKAAVLGLIQRALPGRGQEFDVTISPSIGPPERDTFTIRTSGGVLYVVGTSGVAASWGFYYYLRNYCNAHVSWAGNRIVAPRPLPEVKGTEKVTSNDRFRYRHNVCTQSYSYAYWDWARWERELDWMAMHSYNFPLAFTAQEAIWQRVFLKLGLTQAEVDSFQGGSAFLAWARMGNMQGWGGPLPASWHRGQVALHHKILQRMRDFGMTPIMPAFAGFVPKNFTRVFPSAKLTSSSDWAGFNNTYCCVKLLDVTDPLFQKVGRMFIAEYTAEFGTNHYYNTDTFNEMNPSSSEPSYIRAAGSAVFKAMTAGDPQAVWVMQGWLFVNSGFWQPARAEALLRSVPQGKMIVLDLYSELSPRYTTLKSYYGQPFIWCMLHNYGGNLGLYGRLTAINELPFAGRRFPNSTMIGIGLTGEGINQNDVIYDFMNENSWRTRPRNISQWISNYSLRRYGIFNKKVDAAWQLLARGIYDDNTGYQDHGYFILTTRPSFTSHPTTWFKPEDVFRGWDYFLQAAEEQPALLSSPLFRYDLVDLTRESLQLVFIQLRDDVITAYQHKNKVALSSAGARLLRMLDDLDRVLASDPHFLLGRWLAAARSWGAMETERALHEWNARAQVTIWGPHAEILDYANKQWSGMVSGYYKQRWVLFVQQLDTSLTKGSNFSESQFRQDVFAQVEQPFTRDRTIYPVQPIGESFVISKEIHSTFRPAKQSEFFRALYDVRVGRPSSGMTPSGRWARGSATSRHQRSKVPKDVKFVKDTLQMRSVKNGNDIL